MKINDSGWDKNNIIIHMTGILETTHRVTLNNHSLSSPSSGGKRKETTYSAGPERLRKSPLLSSDRHLFFL
jgi:hypothetical protein